MSRRQTLAEKFDHHAHLNAGFRALARDARVRAAVSPVSFDQSVGDYDRSDVRRTEMQSASASDFDYFRMRAAKEKAAAGYAPDIRVRRVHLEMAERYQALIRVAEAATRTGIVS